MPGESFSNPCDCIPAPGTTVPTTPYVVSIAGLDGIVALGNTGAIIWTTLGNTIYADLSANAGLGSVTSVAVGSNNSNLSVVSGSPITTLGTITLGLAGNIGSISGLVMAADQMLYSTGVATFTTTSLVANARTLLGHTFAQMRTDLGLIIGTNVQAWSADLDRFVTDFSFILNDWTLTGTLTISSDITAHGVANFTDVVTIGDTLSVTNGVTAASFAGIGTLLTALDGDAITTGTVGVATGGTNLSSYTTGDLIYASAGTTLAKLADVAAGSYLRSGGVTTAPLWSTLTLPNAATTGDILHATGTNAVGRLAAVAVNNVLLSGGVGVISSWGKVTSSHVNNTIPTMSGGVNSDITSFVGSNISFSDGATFNNDISVLFGLIDGTASLGNSGDLLTSTGSGVAWSKQIILDTLSVNVAISVEATITAGGVTGNQTINKALGSVNIAAGGSAITVTNSLVDANSCVFCQIATNDATAIIKNVVSSAGQFVIRTTAAVTAETRINFEVKIPI